MMTTPFFVINFLIRIAFLRTKTVLIVFPSAVKLVKSLGKKPERYLGCYVY